MHTEAVRSLSPAQAAAKESLIKGFDFGHVFVLGGETGRGKTTVLRHIRDEFGGCFLSIAELVEHAARNHPLALEESLYQIVLSALKTHPVVIVDDFELLQNTAGCHHMYPRMGWLNAIALGLFDYAEKAGKKLIYSYGGNLPAPLYQRAVKASIARFRVEDYQALAGVWLGEKSLPIDFPKVFRFAPKLNAHQLKAACDWLMAGGQEIHTEVFIEYLRSQRLTSNVDLDEVQAVELAELVGVDDVIRSLEIHIAFPLENDRMAGEMNLRSKRGVLLYGPPGTGKTTVGRALAHRLKGKFFLIDGTFIAGSGDFYARVHQVFEAAKENAPAVIFIDDADAIFEGGEEQGLYRYLLTMLDGLESESAGRICVMMTAMEVGNLPLALVRSGRVELWLEMKLPSAGARRIILKQQIAKTGLPFSVEDLGAVLTATEGFTGADLKRVVEDAKSLFAYESAGMTLIENPDRYLLQAIEGVALNKKRYAEAEAAGRARLAAVPKLSLGAFIAPNISGSF
ncbi:MAG TPA: ATP-binding protein [Bryobacteraceae bacterium]